MSTVSELEQIFRYRVDDLSPIDYLWEPAEFLDYLNQAYWEAAERSGCLIDSTTEDITQLKIRSGENTYSLHNSVLRLVNKPNLKRLNTKLSLLTKNQAELQDLVWTVTVGDSVRALVTDFEQGKVVTYPTFTKAETTVPIISGTSEYALTSAQQVYDLYYVLDSSGEELPQYTVADMPAISATWETDESPIISGVITDYGEDLFRVYPIPTTGDNINVVYGDTIQLSVIRTPTTRLILSTDTPELPEYMHYDLIWWCMKLAYDKRDSETYNPQRAAECDMEFTRRFGPRLSWRTQSFLKSHYNTRARSQW